MLSQLSTINWKTSCSDDVKAVIDGAAAMVKEILEKELDALRVRTPKFQEGRHWKPTETEILLMQALDPKMRWNIDNIEFPRVMTDDDISAMLATKCATSSSQFWRNRDDVEGWLIGKGIKLTA